MKKEDSAEMPVETSPDNPGDTPRRGRPRAFDRDVALQQAMLQFWKHGYESTSLTALTSAMGITPPSLYSAFGDKKRLFLEAVQRYVSGSVNSESIIDSAPTGRAAAFGLLEAAAIGFTGTETPLGCLLATSTLSCSAEAADVQEAVAAIRRGIESRLRSKLDRAVGQGEFPAQTDTEVIAAHVMAVIQGMSTLARDGASRQKLLRVAAQAIRGW